MSLVIGFDKSNKLPFIVQPEKEVSHAGLFIISTLLPSFTLTSFLLLPFLNITVYVLS